MATIYEKTETQTTTDADGNITSKEKKTTTTVKKNEEPDYIKIYSKMWCEFNGIPDSYHTLFLSLATRMTYCDKNNLENSQIVFTCEPNQSAILKECGWKTANPLTKGLKVLCDCGAIRRIARSVYQVNPQYAGKGPWRYNAKQENGGIEDLIATFDFKKKTVKTQIIYSDSDGNEDTVLSKTEITPKPDEES